MVHFNKQKAIKRYHLKSAMNSHRPTSKGCHQNKPLALNTLITHQPSSKQDYTCKLPIRNKMAKSVIIQNPDQLNFFFL